MSASAVFLMLLAMVVVWGGLILSVLAVRAHPERTDFPPGGEDDLREDDAPLEHDT
ncbi:methionine/alanine import family NSS transporter small subunit [Cellulosimicrobium arenosum]|uniref:Methionine/alanine import family NSS transporter small subunit n=1 Tax=Cellulosimicrobium arenosum TaxID=2708133 RepID=A0A927G8K5_9MICO|nr:methionine/alanine import family NSS transporter small subunit [Cellulosimicrobium arenosum]MBD8078544.1 methionine/alanine import family NSS transporter small subunit [Cellulosimicrobium arenosum]